nr:MAG TPA: hypothetical protein [Caudoviricetes sp.]
MFIKKGFHPSYLAFGISFCKESLGSMAYSML